MRDTSLLTEYTHNASFCRATACGGVFLVVEIPVLVWNDLSNTLGAYQSCSHLPFSLILNVVTWCVIIVHVTVCHADRSDWCRALYCTVGVSSSSIGELDVTQIVHVYVVLQKYFGVLSVTYCCATEDALNNNNSLSLSLCRLCLSNNILQSYQPAVQHHLRVLHWGHLSSHDGLQHVSYLLFYWSLTCPGPLVHLSEI